jgi:16S rRNA (guanine527-N7)-methyltransferase
MDNEASRLLVDNVFEWVGLEPPADTYQRLQVFADFLEGEAATAGGIGPTEGTKVWRRHIGDSLTFLAGLVKGTTRPPDAVVDLGSGVGLPGIPLAVALPEVHFVLLDRSARRCLLARRAVRMLQLANVEVVEGDATRFSCDCDAVVSRAALPVDRFIEVASDIPLGAAKGLTAGSHGNVVPVSSAERRVIEVPTHILGDNVWLIEVSLSGRLAG